MNHRDRTKYIEEKRERDSRRAPVFLFLNLCSFLVLTFLQHSAALHACRAQKGGEDSDNETDDFSPSVLFHRLYILILKFLHFLILTFPSACARRRYAYGLAGSG